MITVETKFQGHRLQLETGRLAPQADGAVLVRYGKTEVLATICAAKEQNDNAPFFPLTCLYNMKYYAAGRIPGGFFKRETRPSDHEVLTSRMIDRPLRPLFPKSFLAETQIIATVLSYDEECSPEFAAFLGASAATYISGLPFLKPIAGVAVGRVDDEWVINPSAEQKKTSDLDLFLAASKESITMVEAGAKELSEENMQEALILGHEAIATLIDLQQELHKKLKLPKMQLKEPKADVNIQKAVKKLAESKLKKALKTVEKKPRAEALRLLKKEVYEELCNPESEQTFERTLVSAAFSALQSDLMRSQILTKGIRVDGRKTDQIRPITCETGVLPNAHGSAVFTRGETQVLAAVTMGTKEDRQMIDQPEGVYEKHFYLNYNFPAFCVGEVKRLGPPSRREVGHGRLAERGLSNFIPSLESFPYTLRVVCEVLSSNGSSSMASVCSGSLALFDAGVPLKKAVAGIAMGLVYDGKKHAVLSDILGDEDHVGDMDFKVVGTKDGITALQMDVKIDGVSTDMLKEALQQAHAGRLHILAEMEKSQKEPRKNLAPSAPRYLQCKVPVKRIKDIIGPGGQVIKSITQETGTKISVEDNGMVNILSSNQESAERALAIVQSLIQEVEIGKIYNSTIRRVVDFGLFVECIPGTEGLVHISELTDEHNVDINTLDYSVGQMIKVKTTGYDKRGKLKLSAKNL